MRDDQLLNDLNDAKLASEKFDWLTEKKIRTYSQLFAFIQDEANDAKLRWEACYGVLRLWEIVDKRQAVPCLLKALYSGDEDVRGAAANTLGMLKSKRAFAPLLSILRNRSESMTVRHWVINGLNLIGDKRAIPLFWAIIDDPNEHVELRSRAIEEMFEDPDPIEKFIQLLADPIPDIRFWAAYKLACTFEDISSALSVLDLIVAFDHQLPAGFGWQVCREAMRPLESIYYRNIIPVTEDEDGSHWYSKGSMYLISPAPEYSTLLWRFRHWTADMSYITDDLPEIKLRIEPEWLAEQLLRKWPDIKLNLRQPRPQAYLLDWHLQVEELHLVGALHRDQYAVVITGDDLIYAFAEWYRDLFPESQHLYFYQWADPHVELKPGMSAAEIEQASSQESISAAYLQEEDLTFG